MKEITYYVGDDGKKYNTLEECETADKEYAEIHAKELEEKKVRKERAEEVNKAYQEFIEIAKQGQKRVDDVAHEEQEKIDAAKKHYRELYNNFCKDYGKYISVTTANDDSWTDLFKMFDSFFRF